MQAYKENLNETAVNGNSVKIAITLLLVGFIAFLVLVGVGIVIKRNSPVSYNSSSSSGTKQLSLLSSQLNDVQKGLVTLTREIQKPKKEINLAALTSGVNGVSHKVQQMVLDNETHIKALIKSSQSELKGELQNQIGGLSERVNTLAHNQHKKAYLSSSNLPFKVIAIDNVQEEGVAEVSYAYKNVALERGDTLAGWEVMKVDYASQSVLLKNTKNQYVKFEFNQGEA